MGYFRHATKTQYLLAVTSIIFFYLSPLSRAQMIPDAQVSHPGLAMESRYSEAVIAYNKRQVKKSLVILDELIKIAPSNKEYLEMKALALKGSGDPKQSLEVYLRLYAIAKDKEQGPYAFELGTLYTQLNQLKEAEVYFKKAYDLNFNKTASQFYLGLSAFQLSSFGDAEKAFLEVSQTDLEPFSLMSKYYLGISYFKLLNGSQGVQQLVEVRKETRDSDPGSIGRTLGDASEKMLAPFSVAQWFGNIVLQSQFDSNIQLLPTGYSNPTGTNNPATLKMNFSGGGGYMTAPLNTIQWVAGYRASYNYNLNSSAKGYEYFTNNFSLYANYNALARTSAGLKVESSFAFQNALLNSGDSTSGYQYQKYNFTVGSGLYLHHQINREWRGEGEVNFRSQKFFADSNLSGRDYSARVSARSDLGRSYFNPGASLVFENNRAQGDAYFYTGYGLGFTNAMNLPGSIMFSQSLDLLFTGYTHQSPSRNDQNYTLRVSAVKLLNPKFSLLADMSYIKNISSQADQYTYNQFITSFGVGYTF